MKIYYISSYQIWSLLSLCGVNARLTLELAASGMSETAICCQGVLEVNGLIIFGETTSLFWISKKQASLFYPAKLAHEVMVTSCLAAKWSMASAQF